MPCVSISGSCSVQAGLTGKNTEVQKATIQHIVRRVGIVCRLGILYAVTPLDPVATTYSPEKRINIMVGRFNKRPIIRDIKPIWRYYGRTIY